MRVGVVADEGSTAVRQLPRGRHQFTRAAVAASQRARLLKAVAQAVAEKGYAAATVADVVALAAVSRRTFYEQYPDLESCFLYAYQTGMELLLRRIREEVRNRPDAHWRGRARAAIEAYLAELARQPAAAWAFSIEVVGAGTRVLERRAAVLERWMQQWRALHRIACKEEPALAEIRDDQLLFLVGGIEEMVRDCLRARGAAQLTELGAPMTAIAIATLGG